MELCNNRIACGDGSVHSGYSGYTSLLSDISGSSMGSSSSRWDSEAGPDSSNKEKKSSKPKMPPRRQRSSSPPSSPTAASKVRSPRCRSSQPNRKRVAERVRVDNEAVDCRRIPTSFEEPLTLASTCTAASGMLRIPQRRASSAGEPRSRSPRNASDRIRVSRRHGKNGEPHTSRNVGQILGEAIRELGFEEETASPYSKQ